MFGPEASAAAVASLKAMAFSDWKLPPPPKAPESESGFSFDRALDPNGTFRHRDVAANPLLHDGHEAQLFASVVKARSQGKKWSPPG